MIVAEIGLNHLGNLKLLNKLIDKLTKTTIDGITLQILKKEDLKKLKLSHCYLSFLEIDKFIIKIKNKNKKVGLAVGDKNIVTKLKFIKKLDFIKVLSKDFNDQKLISYLLTKTKSKIYLSTGFAKEKEINFILKKNKSFKKRIVLIYTDFNKKMSAQNLINIELMRRQYKSNIAYGNHSQNKKLIIYSKIFNPESIFFYIKDNLKKFQKINYPDDFHALKINELNSYLKKIKNMVSV